MVWVRVAFHENDGNHENDENDEDNSDSYKQGVECWIRGNHGNHENDENHENPGCKPRVPQTIGLEIPESSHVYLNSVQQMVSGELAGEGLQTGFSRHGFLPPRKAPLDTVYRLREHLNSVQRMVSGGYCEGLSPDTVCWTRLRNTWSSKLLPNYFEKGPVL